jgi:hypothetical protein
MYKCEYCDIEFDNPKIKANHVKWQHCDLTEYKLNASISAKSANARRYGNYINDTVKCFKCSTSIEVVYREGGKKLKYYCSRKCANSRGPRTEAFKIENSKRIKNLWKSGHYDQTSALNHTKQSKRYFSSKNERLILEHFKNTYIDDIWTSGAGLIHNGKRLSRDMYSKKLRICFEYDGIWHFEDVHGQLADKQLKDRLLEDWCILNNWRLIRIDEMSFKNIKQIEDLIYNQSDQIIKVGSRYTPLPPAPQK